MMLLQKPEVMQLIREKLRVLEDRMFSLRAAKNFYCGEFWQVDGGIKEVKELLKGLEALDVYPRSLDDCDNIRRGLEFQLEQQVRQYNASKSDTCFELLCGGFVVVNKIK
jgi:hypothetical protein